MKRQTALSVLGYICFSLIIVLATAAAGCDENSKVKEAENDLKGAKQKLEEFDNKLDALNQRRENLNDKQKEILDRLPNKKDKMKNKLDAAERELEELKRFLESGESLSRAQQKAYAEKWESLKSEMAGLSKSYAQGNFPSITAAQAAVSSSAASTASNACDPSNIPEVKTAVAVALSFRTALIAEGSYSTDTEARLIDFVLNTIEIETSEAFGRSACL